MLLLDVPSSFVFRPSFFVPVHQQRPVHPQVGVGAWYIRGGDRAVGGSDSGDSPICT